MQRLETVKNALLSAHENVGHYRALKQEPPYIVWAEDSANQFAADGINAEQALSGTADLFTLQEYDPIAQEIQDAFNKAGIAWYLNTIQYEEDTKYIHYEWAWEV